MTYDPRFGRIVYTPVEEMKSLRSTTPIDSVTNAGSAAPLKASTASDVEVFFEKPSAATTPTVATADNSTTVYLHYVPGAAEVECGIISRGGTAKDSVSMLESDSHVYFRVFIDGTVIEAYWQDGRVAMTGVFPAHTQARAQAQAAADVHLNVEGGDPGVKVTNATSWQMSSIYITKEEVLEMTRL